MLIGSCFSYNAVFSFFYKTSDVYIGLITCAIIFFVTSAAFVSIIPQVNASMNSTTTTTTLSNHTNGNSLRVDVEYINTDKTNPYFKVLFFNPESDRLERHIDYDFIIIMNNQKKIFQLSNASGHPMFPVHSSNGIGVIPIPHDVGKGEFTIEVIIDGISFVPVEREEVQFQLTMI